MSKSGHSSIFLRLVNCWDNAPLFSRLVVNPVAVPILYVVSEISDNQWVRIFVPQIAVLALVVWMLHSLYLHKIIRWQKLREWRERYGKGSWNGGADMTTFTFTFDDLNQYAPGAATDPHATVEPARQEWTSVDAASWGTSSDPYYEQY